MQGRKVTSVACGEHHTAVVLDDGTLYTFGSGGMVNLGMEIGAAGIAEARGGGGVARAQSHVGRVRRTSHGRGLGRRHTARSVMAAMVDLGMEIGAAGIAEARGGGGVARAQSHVGRVRQITRPWSWTTAHCTRSVMANMVDLGMEIEAAGITEARGGGGVARAQSHVGRVRL